MIFSFYLFFLHLQYSNKVVVVSYPERGIQGGIFFCAKEVKKQTGFDLKARQFIRAADASSYLASTTFTLLIFTIIG
jgi:hypothetical protein